MHTAIGLTEADDNEDMKSFGPYVKTNPAFVDWAFFALNNTKLTEDTIGNLRAVVTPESIPHWNFKRVKMLLAKHSLASKVHFLDENTACMKYLPEVDRTPGHRRRLPHRRTEVHDASATTRSRRRVESVLRW
ncbi:hypothetical protein [Amycolatopsis thailandensis]|uniref:hypothetical protein n=1 Tax=Amycolatopsis thailandensis TaxID=589330 RepID=UPI0011783F56|nr:hypothetical protein [Amycolatopsis thailandensis]